MNSPLVLDFLKSAVAPAIAVGLLFLLVGGRKEPLRACLQAIIWAVAFSAGAYVLVGRLTFPPYDVNEGFTWCALALALFVCISPRPVGSRYLVRALFVLALGYLTLWPIHDSLGSHVHLRNLLAFFFLALGTWSILECSADRVKPPALIALPMISATALSMLLLFKGSASFAQLVSVMCALLGAVLAVALIAPQKVSSTGILPFVSVLIVAFMAAGHFYLEINPWFMIYLALPFLVLWMRRWIPFVPQQAIGEAVMLGLIAGVPLIYFVWSVYKASGPLY